MDNHSRRVMSQEAAALAGSLVAARETGTLVQFDDRPFSFEDALAVQAKVMHALNETAPMSKIGLDKGGRPIAAPVFKGVIYRPGARISYPACGFSGLEVEIAIRLGETLTPELARAGLPAVMSVIDAVYVGVEFLGPRLKTPTLAPPLVRLADNLGAAGYVLDDTREWSESLNVDGMPLEVTLNGEAIFDGAVRHPFGGVLIALQKYALEASDRFGFCNAGQMITTGTLCGVLPIDVVGDVTVKLGSSPRFGFSIV